MKIKKQTDYYSVFYKRNENWIGYNEYSYLDDFDIECCSGLEPECSPEDHREYFLRKIRRKLHRPLRLMRLTEVYKDI